MQSNFSPILLSFSLPSTPSPLLLVSSASPDGLFNLMALLLPVFKTAPDTRCENAGELRDAGRAQRERPNANKREEGMSNIKEEEELRKPSQSVNPFQYFQSHAGKKEQHEYGNSTSRREVIFM